MVAKVEYWNDKGTQSAEIYYTEYEVYRLGQEIGSMKAPDRSEIEYLKHKYQPLFAEDNIRNIPMNAYCDVYLYNRQTYHGNFFRLKEQTLQLQYEGRFLDIPMTSIKKLRYWSEGRELRFVKKITIASFVIGGLAGGQIIYTVLSAPVKYQWFYHSTGAIIGGTVGYKLTPSFIEKLQPKTIIEFRKSKIKRLDSIGRLTYTFKKLKGKIWHKHGKQD